LFLKCGSELNLSQLTIDALSFALLDLCASNMPKPIRVSSGSALKQAVSTGPLVMLAPALASRASHKNADVAENAMVFCEKAVKALEAKSNAAAFGKELDLGRLLPALHFGINAKSAKAKKAAVSVCVSVGASLSIPRYDEEISKLAASNLLMLTPLQIEELKAAAKPKASAKAVDEKAEEAERKKKLKDLRVVRKSDDTEAFIGRPSSAKSFEELVMKSENSGIAVGPLPVEPSKDSSATRSAPTKKPKAIKPRVSFDNIPEPESRDLEPFAPVRRGAAAHVDLDNPPEIDDLRPWGSLIP
jgi:hypothetical protein